MRNRYNIVTVISSYNFTHDIKIKAKSAGKAPHLFILNSTTVILFFYNIDTSQIKRL